MSTGLRILRGLEINLIGQAALILVNLAVTPRIIHGLGPDHYALYTLIWTFMSYLMLLNLGTGLAVQTYTARLQISDEASLASLLRKTLVFHLGMSSAGALLFWAARDWIIRYFLHEAGLSHDAAVAFACVAAAAPGYFVLQFGMNILYGLQRFAAYNVFQFLQVASVPLCALGLLSAGFGLREIAAAFLAAHSILALAALWSVRRILRPCGASPDHEGSAGFVRYCAKSFSAQLSWLLTYQGDRLFITSMLPLGQLAYYSVSAGLAQKFNSLLGSVCATVFPMMTELHGQGEESKSRRIYLKASELSLFFMLPVTILSFVLVPQFMTLWLGEDFSRLSTWPFRLLLLANLVYLGTALPYSVAVGRGSPQYSAYINFAKVVLLMALWPLCIPRWGILGASIGLLAAELATTPAYIGYIHRRFLGLGWREFWSEACRRPVFAALGPTILGLATHGAIGTWTGILGFAAAGSVLFFGLGYWALDRDAKGLLDSWLKSKLHGNIV